MDCSAELQERIDRELTYTIPNHNPLDRSWIYHPNWLSASHAFWAENGITTISAIFANENSNNSARNYTLAYSVPRYDGDPLIDGVHVNLEVPS